MKEEKSRLWEIVPESMKGIARDARSNNLQDVRCERIWGGSGEHLCILDARGIGLREEGI